MNYVILAAVLCLAGCEPLEDSNWVGNSLPDLNWEPAHGRDVRPDEAGSMMLHYLPHESRVGESWRFSMPTDQAAFDLPTGRYDVLAVSGDYPVDHLDVLSEATLSLPYVLNARQERVVTENPRMVYAGVVQGICCHYLRRIGFSVPMKRVMKQLHFVVNIGDEQELSTVCRVELAGMSGQVHLATLEPDRVDEYVHLFQLEKVGRHWNEEGCLTTYKGHINILGVQGKNILRLTFRDGEGVPREVTTDLSPYLGSWIDDEVTIRLAINLGEDTRLQIEGFEPGNTTDFEF